MSAAGEQSDSIVDFILELFATRGAEEYKRGSDRDQSAEYHLEEDIR